jgi:hypothetical protein
MDGLVGVLPGGYWDAGGELHRQFELRALTGREEELLVRTGQRESASLVTAVLSRCVLRLGRHDHITADMARRLLVADRQYLLLMLRRATFGDDVRASLLCPWPDCGQRVSIDFSIAEVPVVEAADRGPVYSTTLSEDCVTVGFRLPNGEDQEQVSPLLARGEVEALDRLLSRCLHRIGADEPPGEDRVRALSPRARAEIEGAMRRVAPRVEQTMDATCAECGRAFLAPFDVQRFFFGELRTDADLLYREVHYLAYHYGWSEHEIMAMERERRRRYIGVLAEEIGKLNDAG